MPPIDPITYAFMLMLRKIREHLKPTRKDSR